MSFNFRGVDGVQARVQELQARIASLREPQTPPVPAEIPALQNTFRASLAGAIASARNARVLTPRDPASANAPLDPVALGLVPGLATPPPATGTGDLRALARSIGEKYGLDPDLFEALVQQESAFNPRAVSPVGAQGLAQLMPRTAASLGVTDPFDPVQNLDGGARYLAQMLREFDGDIRLALAAYNAGPGAVRRAGGIPPFPETQNYVRKVLAAAGR